MANVARSKARAFRGSDELWAALDDRAVTDGVSPSDVLRAALVAHLGLDPEEVKPVAGRQDGRAVRSGRAGCAQSNDR